MNKTEVLLSRELQLGPEQEKTVGFLCDGKEPPFDKCQRSRSSAGSDSPLRKEGEVIAQTKIEIRVNNFAFVTLTVQF